MKKKWMIFSLALCMMFGAICFTACGSSTMYITPEFTITNEGYKIELVTNRYEDYDLQIEGQKLEHSKLISEDCFQYKWIIKKTESDEFVGWIETGGGYEGSIKKGFKFGYSPFNSNGVLTYGCRSVSIFLKTTDLSVFDDMEFSVNVGTSTKAQFDNPCNASLIFREYDQDSGEFIVADGAENFVCVSYTHDLSDIKPKTIKNISYTLNFANLSI